MFWFDLIFDIYGMNSQRRTGAPYISPPGERATDRCQPAVLVAESGIDKANTMHASSWCITSEFEAPQRQLPLGSLGFRGVVVAGSKGEGDTLKVTMRPLAIATKRSYVILFRKIIQVVHKISMGRD